MQRTLFKYCLGGAPKEHAVSAQCQLVRAIVPHAFTLFSKVFKRAQSRSDSECLTEILSILDGTEEIESDTFRWIRALHGCGGSEGYVLDSSDEEANFWHEMHKRYPEHAGICALAADSSLLNGHRALAQDLFWQSRQLDPEVFRTFPYDPQGLFLDSKYRLDYQLICLKETRDECPEELEEAVAELRAEYANRDDVQQRIDEALVQDADVSRKSNGVRRDKKFNHRMSQNRVDLLFVD